LLTISIIYRQGNEAWVESLENKFHKEFKAAPSIQWVTAGEGRVAGEVRSAGGSGFGAGNVTFVNVYEAGFVLQWARVLSFY
jgi:cathepsin A (carboxypeptidase C)